MIPPSTCHKSHEFDGGAITLDVNKINFLAAMFTALACLVPTRLPGLHSVAVFSSAIFCTFCNIVVGTFCWRCRCIIWLAFWCRFCWCSPKKICIRFAFVLAFVTKVAHKAWKIWRNISGWHVRKFICRLRNFRGGSPKTEEEKGELQRVKIWPGEQDYCELNCELVLAYTERLPGLCDFVVKEMLLLKKKSQLFAFIESL